MKEPNTSFWEKSFLSRQENFTIKAQRNQSHPERQEIVEYIRESYKKENEDFVGLSVFSMIFGAILGIITFGSFLLGAVAIIVVLVADVVIFYYFGYPVLKSYNQVTTFYITNHSLISEEIAFKRVKTQRWALENISKMQVTRDLKKRYEVIVSVKNRHAVSPALYAPHTLISLPQNPENLNFCLEFLDLFRVFDLPVDTTEIPLTGGYTDRRPRTRTHSRSRKSTSIRNNPKEVSCQACDSMNAYNSAYCMQCGTDLQITKH